MSRERVLVGMSGGIDSTIAAHLLLKQGYDVEGISFRFVDNEIEELKTIESLANRLGIVHHIVDVRELFRDTIVEYFVDEYMNGRTPFPCVKCNSELKWKLIFDYATIYNCQKVSMGHYVSIVKKGELFFIKEGADKDKDQSFFLWGLTQSQLSKIIFPLGNMTKPQVREIAASIGMNILLTKKESTGACFCPSDYRPYLKEQMNIRNLSVDNGFFEDENGNVIGKHSGYPFYTVGQRRGLNLKANKALYVKSIDPKRNRIVLSELKSIYKQEFMVHSYNLLSTESLTYDFSIFVRIRYRKQNTPCNIHILDSNKLRVELKEPLEAIAPGQSAVFYQNGIILGGGVIE